MGGDPDYLRPYLEVVSSRGPGFEALLWTDRASQASRFDVIASMVELGGRVVGDIGCGRADLWSYLAGAARPSRYVGVEAIEAIAREAEGVIAGVPGARIERADFVRDPGVFERLGRSGVEAVVFSGSLNTLPGTTARRVLDAAWRSLAGRRGGSLVFNVLSDADGGIRRRHAGPTVMHDVPGLVRWALERTTRVRLRHDYLDGRDATIAMEA